MYFGLVGIKRDYAINMCKGFEEYLVVNEKASRN